jgi:hypothetical protein
MLAKGQQHSTVVKLSRVAVSIVLFLCPAELHTICVCILLLGTIPTGMARSTIGCLLQLHN